MIPDNLIIAHEVFHALKNKVSQGKENVAIKLDMNKVYDRVEWCFIEKVLLAFGFHATWLGLVMKLVTSVTYHYKVNGFTSSTITPQRGLHQGDPLSPYLFILVADVLSLMINKAVRVGSPHGFQIARGALVLTHLMFVDDAFLFAQADQGNIYQLLYILNVYSKSFGQCINLTKSGLICVSFCLRGLNRS